MTSSTANTAPALERDASRGRTGFFIPAVLLVVAAVLRFLQLGAESFWFDEIIMANLTRQPTAPLLEQLFATARAPLYPLLGHFWLQIFGASEAGARALSALFGVLSVPLVYVIGEEWFRRRVGLIAAVLMTLSAFQVYYSQEYRYYSLVILLTLLAALFYGRALRGNRPVRNFLLYTLFSVLLFYTHPLAAALPIAAFGLSFLALLLWRKSFRRLVPIWLVSQALIVVGALPTVALRLLRAGDGNLDTVTGPDGGLTPWWLEAPPVWEPVRTIANFMVLGLRYVVWLAIAAGVIVLLAGIVLMIRRRGVPTWLGDLRRVPARLWDAERPDWQLGVVLVLFWLLAPLALAMLSSFTVLPMYVERYVSAASPALYLLTAVLLVALDDVIPSWLTTGVLAVWLAFSLQQYYAQDIKEQWDELAAYVESEMGAGDGLAFASDVGNMAETETVRKSFDWYYSGVAPECDVNLAADDADVIGQLEACTPAGGRTWLVTRWSADERVAALDAALADRAGEAGGLLEDRWYIGDISVYVLDLGG